MGRWDLLMNIFCDETKVVRFFNGYRGVFEVREWIFSSSASETVKLGALSRAKRRSKKACCFSSRMLFPQAVIF